MSDGSRTTPVALRPVLKWAGGKRQLLPWLRRFYPPDFAGYWEPFLGSGAVFIDLYTHGRLDGKRVALLDNNADLVGCYAAIRDRCAEVVAALEALAAAHRRHPRAHYYKVRNEQFNPGRQRFFGGRRPAVDRYPPSLAAMLIYLNRTGYNGLFRLNASGAFNVPAGRYANPRIVDVDTLQGWAAALSSPHVRLKCGTFADTFKGARQGDFLYFDPPYAPLSATARFTAYTAGGFGQADQRRLQKAVIALARRGCLVLLSNSTAPEIAALYDGNPEARDAGLQAYQVPARRAINSRASQRGTIREYLITNIRPQDSGPEDFSIVIA